MRPFYEIKAEINTAKAQKAKIENELPGIRYSSISLDIGEGVKALIFSIIFSVVMFFLTGVLMTNDDGIGFGLLLFIGIAVVFFVLAIKAIAGYIKGTISRTAAGVFTFLSLPLLLTGIYAFVSGNQNENVLDKLFPLLDVKIAKWLETPMDLFYTTIECAGAALILTSALLFFSSLIKLIKEITKKQKVMKRKKELSDEVQFLNSKIADLEKEYQDTHAEAEKQFEQESQKLMPDIDSIKKLERIGLDSAREWLKQQEKDADRAESIMIYESEKRKKNPDADNMKKAAEMGNPDANLWMAKRIISTYAAELDVYTKPELREAFADLPKYAERAAGSGDEDVLFLVNAVAKLMYFVYCDYKASLSQSEMLTSLKRIRKIKAESSLPPEDKPLAEIALNTYVHAVNLRDEMEEENPKESKRIYEPAQWSDDYARANADFCVAWCDELNDKIIAALNERNHRKVSELFEQVTDGLIILNHVLYGTEAISAYTYFSLGVFTICSNLPYDEEDKFMLAKSYFDIAQDEAKNSNEFTLLRMSKIAEDLCDGSVTASHFRNTVCPKFPDDLIGGFLNKQSARYETLWNNVDNGTAFK